MAPHIVGKGPNMKTERFWIGTQSDPKDRLQIEVTAEDARRMPNRYAPGAVTVTDLLTGKKLTVRAASCGPPRCMCALEIA